MLRSAPDTPTPRGRDLTPSKQRQDGCPQELLLHDTDGEDEGFCSALFNRARRWESIPEPGPGCRQRNLACPGLETDPFPWQKSSRHIHAGFFPAQL